MIKLTFLGTSHAIPTAERNHTAVLLTYKGENILVDCGEGTQRQFRKARLSPTKVTKLLITHWHGDHILGIPGLLQTLAFSDYKKTLEVYGPKGTKRFMKEILKTFVFEEKVKIKVKEINKEGKFFEDKEFYLESKNMVHGAPTLSYCFVKKGQRRIDKKKLEKSKLPKGPILQKLKDGKDIRYKGKKYLAKNLTYMAEAKKVCFVLDTKMNKSIVPFVKGADLFVSEASYSHDDSNIAREHKHLTAKQAAESAKKAKVKKLILIHISDRYKKNPKKILNEAKKVFKKVYLAKDLDEFKVK